MSAHTPGPWQVEMIAGRFHGGVIRSLGVWREYVGGRGYPQVALATAHDQLISEEERIANATLIAAAPELLAALKALLDELTWRVGDGAEGEPCLMAARAAIAKAEGT